MKEDDDCVVVIPGDDERAVRLSDTVRGWRIGFWPPGEWCNQHTDQWVTNEQAERMAEVFLRGRSVAPVSESLPEDRALIDELQEKLAYIGDGCYGVDLDELVRRVVTVGSEAWKRGHWLGERIGEAIERDRKDRAESLPEGVTPNPQTYTLAAGVALEEDGWEWEGDRCRWHPWHPGAAACVMSYTIRRVEAPPQPATEEVEIGELIRRMVNDGVRPLTINGEAVAWWSINENGLSTSPHGDEDGFRTTWPRNVVTMVTVLRTDGTEGGAS